MRAVFLGFCLFLTSLIVAAQKQGRGSTAEEFKIKKDYLRNRYRDFYIRDNEYERRDRRRQSAAGEQKKARQVIRDAYEKARKDFVINRKAKPVLSDEQHLQEIAEQKKKHEQARKEYIVRREELRRIDANTGVIPEWIEYKLYEPYEPYETTDSLEAAAE